MILGHNSPPREASLNSGHHSDLTRRSSRRSSQRPLSISRRSLRDPPSSVCTNVLASATMPFRRINAAFRHTAREVRSSLRLSWFLSSPSFCQFYYSCFLLAFVRWRSCFSLKNTFSRANLFIRPHLLRRFWVLVNQNSPGQNRRDSESFNRPLFLQKDASRERFFIPRTLCRTFLNLPNVLKVTLKTGGLAAEHTLLANSDSQVRLAHAAIHQNSPK